MKRGAHHFGSSLYCGAARFWPVLCCGDVVITAAPNMAATRKSEPLQDVGDVEKRDSYHTMECYLDALLPHLSNDKHFKNMRGLRAGSGSDKEGKGARFESLTHL